MNRKRVAAVGLSVVAVAAIVGGSWAIAVSATPEPAASPSVSVTRTATPTQTPAATPTPTPTVEPAVEQPAAPPVEELASAPAPEQVVPAPAPEPAAPEPAPIRCPPGSQANSGDGGNDTSCLPEVCFHITLPDPANPECQIPFKP